MEMYMCNIYDISQVFILLVMMIQRLIISDVDK